MGRRNQGASQRNPASMGFGVYRFWSLWETTQTVGEIMQTVDPEFLSRLLSLVHLSGNFEGNTRYP